MCGRVYPKVLICGKVVSQTPLLMLKSPCKWVVVGSTL